MSKKEEDKAQSIKPRSVSKKSVNQKCVDPCANKKHHSFNYDIAELNKQDISLLKLIQYITIFFIPLMLFALVALKLGSMYQNYFGASPAVTAKIFMFPFMIVIFFFFIPFIRERENVAGIRYSIFAFFIIGTGLTLPSALKGHYSDFLMIPSYFASYVLLTFFFCPEVLGIERNITDWFRHRKQMIIVFIYVGIVLLYVTGFGGLYYDLYSDSTAAGDAFSFSNSEESPTIFTFIYYSMVSFTSTGYGEILPVSAAARLIFFFEATMALVLNVLFIAILLVFISNAEFLSRTKRDEVLVGEVKKEHDELKKEEAELRRVEKEVKSVEKKETFIMWLYKKIKGR